MTKYLNSVMADEIDQAAAEGRAADWNAVEARQKLDDRAAAAWELIKRGQDWQSWKVIAEAMHEGRTWAMHKAMTNQPVGKTYNRAMGEWLDAPERKKWTQEIDRSTRNQAIWCHENLAAIEKWRETLGVTQRLLINHPATVKRNFEKMNVEKAIARAEKKKQVKIDAEELDKLNADLAKYKKQAEADGSLFDIKKDTAKKIAEAMRHNATVYKLVEIHKALGEEIKAARAAQKHAG